VLQAEKLLQPRLQFGLRSAEQLLRPAHLLCTHELLCTCRRKLLCAHRTVLLRTWRRSACCSGDGSSAASRSSDPETRLVGDFGLRLVTGLSWQLLPLRVRFFAYQPEAPAMDLFNPEPGTAVGSGGPTPAMVRVA
jgi:hypothetical protein